MRQPIFYQRLESAVIFVASVALYFHQQFSLLWFVIFLFSIDVFMLGYLVNKLVGAHIYNIGHSFVIPATLLTLGAYYDNRLFIAAAIIWTAHIGMDRALGYGLKFASGFGDTHLGRIGRSEKSGQ